MDERKANVRQDWETNAARWRRRERQTLEFTRPVTAALLRLAGVRSGIRLLDVACGSGDPMTSAAPLVGYDGLVVAVDLAGAMLAGAREKVIAGRLRNVRLAQMGSESLAVRPASFDVVPCRFGMMFCPNPLQALGEIRSALIPGGRFATAVWAEPARNPYFTIMPRILRSYMREAPPTPRPGVPSPLSWGGQGVVEDLLTTAGFSELMIEKVPLSFNHESVESYIADWRVEGIQELDRQLPGRSPAELAEIMPKVEEALRRELNAYVRDGRLELPAEAICAAGRT